MYSVYFCGVTGYRFIVRKERSILAIQVPVERKIARVAMNKGDRSRLEVNIDVRHASVRWEHKVRGRGEISPSEFRVQAELQYRVYSSEPPNITSSFLSRLYLRLCPLPLLHPFLFLPFLS